MRFFAAELVRETALEQLNEEVPYAIACEVEEFREDRSPVYIRAVLYVERESQKRILIGHKGSRIREIGAVARRQDRGPSSGCRCIWISGSRCSRTGDGDPAALRRLGYSVPEEVAVTLSPQLLAILVCPKCKGELEYRADGARASTVIACRLRYPIRDDIPIMLIDEATPL